MRRVISGLAGTRRATVVGAVLVFVVVLLVRHPAVDFVYDAGRYWAAATKIVTGGDFYTAGGLSARGVLSAVVYLPAAAAAQALGGSLGVQHAAVLVQNAALLAVTGAVILPRLAGRFVTVDGRHILIGSALTVLLFSGFAPYPLMDLAAVVLVMLGLLLIASPSRILIAVGGLSLGAAVNLRPAYVLPAIAVLVVWGALHWRRALLPVAGVIVSIVPQWLLNRIVNHRNLPIPVDTFLITDIQAHYASFGVRYDTIPFTAGDPRQWYCSPSMADAVAGHVPTTTGGVVRAFLENFPTAVVFSLQKITAALQWSFETPYSDGGAQALRFLGFAAVIVTIAGVLALVVLATVRRRDGKARDAWATIAMIAGVLVTLVGSAPEARFAAPLVMTGIVGVLVGGSVWASAGRRARPILIASAAVLVSLTVLGGVSGLAHPADRGDVTRATCAATGGAGARASIDPLDRLAAPVPNSDERFS